MTKSLRVLQVEYIAVLFLLFYCIYHFLSEIQWVHFIAFFAGLDLIGYIPGRIWSAVMRTKRPPQFFYIAYNATHSVLSLLLFSALYWYLIEPDYALLALFVHLAADRGILGNFPKFRSDDFKMSTAEIMVAAEQKNTP